MNSYQRSDDLDNAPKSDDSKDTDVRRLTNKRGRDNVIDLYH